MPAPAGRRQHNWGEFIALPENRSALRAAQTLFRALLRPMPRVPFNPLVLHGPTGTGKSQLVRALANHVVDAEVVITVQNFAAADLARAALAAEAGPNAEPTWADESLRTVDLLILEDLHHLPAKASDALCELLDRRKARRKATLLTMNVGPAVLTHLPRRLTSRLAAGLLVQLEPPSPRSRKVILHAEAKRRGVKLTSDAIEWLASRSTGGGIRPLIGTLQMLAPLGKQFPLPMDRKQVETLLAGSGLPTTTGPTSADIVKRVATAFGVSEKELLGPSRLRKVLLSRQVAMYLVRELTKQSLPRIGSLFGGRDHTTVLHACRKVEGNVAKDEFLAGKVKQLRAEMG